MASKDEVGKYFNSVVKEYNCGDIRELLSSQLDKAGPLLACTVNGIDLVGGMMLGFHPGGSKQRSKEFMRRHLGLNEENSDLMYELVRCGVAHEGIPKLAVQFFVCRGRGDPKKFLYKDYYNSIWLNVSELAHCYLEAIDRIAIDIHTHLSHVPEANSKVVDTYRKALNLVTDDIADFWHKQQTVQQFRGSLSPFLPELLRHFKI